MPRPRSRSIDPGARFDEKLDFAFVRLSYTSPYDIITRRRRTSHELRQSCRGSEKAGYIDHVVRPALCWLVGQRKSPVYFPKYDVDRADGDHHISDQAADAHFFERLKVSKGR